MPEVFIQGGEGKLQAKYSPSEEEKPNIAIVLHPNPKHGGTMDSKVNYAAFKVMKEAGFSTLRINFRGVGKSDGAFTEGEGELNDASVSLDWLQKKNEDFRSCWGQRYVFLKVHREAKATHFEPVIAAISEAGGDLIHILEPKDQIQ